MPTFFCNHCYNTIYDDEKRCPDCGKLKPPQGFPELEKSLDPWLGHVIADRYFVNKRIGRGGVGSVYRVLAMPFGRTFAIKIIDFANLPADSHVETLERRLEREIKALRNLQSPHIVQLYEVLELPDNVVGVVMEYIDGKTLDQVVTESGPLRPKRALKIMRQIANGVLEAHMADMIHRDLKPENIMVERISSGSTDFVHILDFGLVHMDDGLRLTQGFLGTPLYASPEQSMAHEVDLRTDIYSLGGIFFFMLTGTPPFDFESIFEILQAHTQASLPTLYERTDIRFPQEIEELVSTMLAKDPNERPQSLFEVVHHIDQLLQPENKRIFAPPKNLSHKALELGDNSLQLAFPETLGDLPDDISSHLTQDTSQELSEISLLNEVTQTHVDELDEFKEVPESALQFIEDSSFWSKRDFLTLYEEPTIHDFKAISGTHDGRSVALLFEDGSILEVKWSGSLTISPSTAPVEPPQILRYSISDDYEKPTSFFNSEDYFAIGTSTGVVYTISKANPQDYRTVFSHPEKSAVRRLSISHSKVKRKIIAFDNGEVYIAGDGVAHSKSSPGNHLQTNWLRIFENREVQSVAISQAGESFAIVDAFSNVSIYSFAVPGVAYAESVVSNEVKESVFSQDGHVIALLRVDSIIELRHSLSAAKLTTLYNQRENVHYVFFGNNGGFIGYFIHGDKLCAVDLQRDIIRST